MTRKDLETELVVQAFIHECGGPVALRLAELLGAPTKSAWGDLYEQLLTATENLFTQNGRTAVEHLLWLETKMLPACEKIYWKLFSTLNPTHNFNPEEEVVLTEAKAKIPNVTIQQLALLAAQDFLSPGERGQQEPGKADNKQADEHGPESASPDAKQLQNNRKGNLPEPLPEQLEGESLIAEKIVERFLAKNQLALSEDLTKTLAISLSKAAERAAKPLPVGPVKHPKRLNKTKRGNWWDIAIVHKGPGGANGEHRYKLIKD